MPTITGKRFCLNLHDCIKSRPKKVEYKVQNWNEYDEMDTWVYTERKKEDSRAHRTVWTENCQPKGVGYIIYSILLVSA